MRKYGIFLNFKELPKRQMDTMNLFIDVSILIVDEVLIGIENWKAFYKDFEKRLLVMYSSSRWHKFLLSQNLMLRIL